MVSRPRYSKEQETYGGIDSTFASDTFESSQSGSEEWENSELWGSIKEEEEEEEEEKEGEEGEEEGRKDYNGSPVDNGNNNLANFNKNQIERDSQLTKAPSNEISSVKFTKRHKLIIKIYSATSTIGSSSVTIDNDQILLQTTIKTIILNLHPLLEIIINQTKGFFEAVTKQITNPKEKPTNANINESINDTSNIYDNNGTYNTNAIFNLEFYVGSSANSYGGIDSTFASDTFESSQSGSEEWENSELWGSIKEEEEEEEEEKEGEEGEEEGRKDYNGSPVDNGNNNLANFNKNQIERDSQLTKAPSNEISS
ncbi:9751_t:CDS:2, partial [Entrophospora sp. SA101]